MKLAEFLNKNLGYSRRSAEIIEKLLKISNDNGDVVFVSPRAFISAEIVVYEIVKKLLDSHASEMPKVMVEKAIALLSLSDTRLVYRLVGKHITKIKEPIDFFRILVEEEY